MNDEQHTEDTTPPATETEESSTDPGSRHEESSTDPGSRQKRSSADDSDTEGSTDGDDGAEGTDDETDPDTFPRDYVQRLRTESAGYRERAGAAEREVQRLRVESLGMLADPTDLAYDPALGDLDAVRAAVETLLEAKPHLRSRRPGGNIGQHNSANTPEPVSLLGMLRQNA